MFSVRPYQVTPFRLLYLPFTLTCYCGKLSLLSLVLGPVPLPPPGWLLDFLPVPTWVILLRHLHAGGGERSSGGADCSFPHTARETWVVLGGRYVAVGHAGPPPVLTSQAVSLVHFGLCQGGRALQSLVWGYIFLKNLCRSKCVYVL